MRELEDLLKPIQIERFALVEDEWGDWIEGYTPHIVVEGYIRTLSGNERLSSDQHTYFSTHRLYCDKADIKRGDKVILDDVEYRVVLPNVILDKMQVDIEVM